MEDSYKDQKEAFVSGHTGSSVVDINVVSITAATTYLLWAVIKTRAPQVQASALKATTSSTRPHWSEQLMLQAQNLLNDQEGGRFEAKLRSQLCQFVLLCVPLLLVNTVLARYAFVLNAALGGAALLLVRAFPALPAVREVRQPSKAKKDWRKKSFGSSDEDEPEVETTAHSSSVASSRPVDSNLLQQPQLRLQTALDGSPGPEQAPWSHLTTATSSASASDVSRGPSPAPFSPISRTATADAYDGYVSSSSTTHGRQGSTTPIGASALHDHLPFRVSVDSAADAAHAAAHPPTSYRSPDLSLDEGFLSPSKDGSLLRRIWSNSNLLLSRGYQRGRADSYESDSSASHHQRAKMHSPPPPLMNARASLESAASLTYDDVINGSPQSAANAGRAASAAHLPAAKSASLRAARRKEFLTIYRAHMMLMTVICILAVDFKVFPREFAKCESWGTSIMDMGVGSFVLSLGIISSAPLIPSLTSARDRFRTSRQLLLSSLKKAIPLFALGMVRVVMVKGVDYPEHVTEYGVHWNFFLTLAVMPVFGALCRPFTRFARYSVLGLIVAVVYQVLLWTTGLEAYVLSDPMPRVGLIEKNKEGLSSLAGYFAIFLLGMDLGHYLLPLDPYQAFRRRTRARHEEKAGKLCMVLASFSVLYWATYLVLRLCGAQTSRRLANLSYVIWVTAYNTSFLLAYTAVYAHFLQPVKLLALQSQLPSAAAGLSEEQRQADAPRQRSSASFEKRWNLISSAWSPSLLEDLNRHAFAVFLLANLFTGVVNVSMQTMHANTLIALVVLTSYVAISSAIGPVLTWFDVRLPI